MKMKRTGTLLALVVMTTITLTGCFWTPDDAGEGGITLVVDAGAIRASADGDDYGIFLGYIIADDLMRGDPAAAEQAIEEVDTAFMNAVQNLTINANTNPSDIKIDLSFPSIEFQATVFTGTSGSNTFRGLRADREYLVVVIAEIGDSEGVGYTTTVIEGGKDKEVNLNIGDNWDAFYQFLADRYGVNVEPEPASLRFSGVPVESYTFYYDLLSEDSPDLPSTASPYEDWYNDVDVLNTDGDALGKTGNRDEIDSENFTIQGIAPGKTWRLMIVEWSERQYGGRVMVETSKVFLSEPFTLSPGETRLVTFSGSYVAGFSQGSTSWYFGDSSNYQYDSYGFRFSS